MLNKILRTMLLLVALTGGKTLTKADTVTIKHYEIDVKDFTSLDVVDGYNVEYRCSEDSAGYAVYDTTAKMADHIIFENSKGKLSIQKPFHGEGELKEGLPTITVYSRFIKDVRNCGDSTVRVIDPRPTMEMKATVIGNGRLVVRNVDCSKFEGSIKTGNGTLVVTGTCGNATFGNTGTGSIMADNLKAKEVSAKFFGTGSTGVWATELLKVKGVMAGKLYYRDTPEKIKNYSMGVKIYNLDGREWSGEEIEEKETE